VEYVFDIEANGLNPDKIHCMAMDTPDGDVPTLSSTDYERIEYFCSVGEDEYLIGHNIIRYDIPVLERILDIKIKAKLVDTLALSWYLFPERNKHGLADWGETFGIPKPVVREWEWRIPVDFHCYADGGFEEAKEKHAKLMLHRCKEDVKINTMLWEKQKAYLTELYGVDGYWHLIEYLSFKMHCAMLQEQNKWKLDEDKAYDLLSELTERHQEALESLQGVMPKVQKFKKVKRPAKSFKEDKTLSKHGEKWLAICQEYGFDFKSVEVYQIPSHFDEPKATSPQQIKDWLFDLGWSPMTFKYVEDGEDERGYSKKRAIPQVKKGDDLCPSVLKLVRLHPELKYLENLGVLGHRKGLVTGLLKAVDGQGYVIAGIQGLTNTLRFKHAVCVNLPSSRMPYGEAIRELLTGSNGLELCGSDMSSLEDRTKQHYMMPHDPDYVAEMNKDGFDPHLDIAVEAGFLTEAQSTAYKNGDFTKDSKERLAEQRHKGKTTNYASTYGAGAKTIADGAECSLAEGKALHQAYWDRNWSLKDIAKDQTTKTTNGILWLLNPVSKIWHVLRAEKDIFSTLNQSTGTYCFDLWVKEVLKKDVKLVGQFHDEIVFRSPTKYRKRVTEYLKECVGTVNDTLELNRDLDVDVDFGLNYSNIH